MFLSAVSSRFSLVLDPTSRLGGKVGSACEVLKTMRVLYWVNVSESSGASSPGLSQIKGHVMVVVVVVSHVRQSDSHFYLFHVFILPGYFSVCAVICYFGHLFVFKFIFQSPWRETCEHC